MTLPLLVLLIYHNIQSTASPTSFEFKFSTFMIINHFNSNIAYFLSHKLMNTDSNHIHSAGQLQILIHLRGWNIWPLNLPQSVSYFYIYIKPPPFCTINTMYMNYNLKEGVLDNQRQ